MPKFIGLALLMNRNGRISIYLHHLAFGPEPTSLYGGQRDLNNGVCNGVDIVLKIVSTTRNPDQEVTTGSHRKQRMLAC